MRPITFIVPGPITERTGGSIYDRRIADGLRQIGWPVDVVELDAAFPWTQDMDDAAGAQVVAAIRNRHVVIVDGLAASAIADSLEHHASRLRIVPLVHLPLGADVSLDAATAASLADRERRVLRRATRIVVTGPATMRMLAPYQLDAGRIRVVRPGTDRARVVDRPARTVVHLLCVATVNAIKGHETLIRALAQVPREYSWRLTCAGSLTRDPGTATRVLEIVAELGLAGRVAFLGDIDPTEISAMYDNADLFALASRQETYGMAVADALAHGLPVIGTTTGAIPDLVDDDAGLLVPPDNSDRLAEALSRAIADAALRSRLAEGARRAGERLPSWDQAAAGMREALRDLVDHG
jgi:glycosyltransferase involved in cell wall biosynthesis